MYLVNKMQDELLLLSDSSATETGAEMEAFGDDWMVVSHGNQTAKMSNVRLNCFSFPLLIR